MHIVDQESLKRYKNKYNFFETPPKIAAKMSSFLEELGRDVRILEPSAGLGALIDAAITSCNFPPQIDFCELQDEFSQNLQQYNKVGSDFMEYHPGPVYDAVIMNPPYKGNTARKHVDHAWDCLKPGGRLVALVGKNGADFIDEEFYGHIFHREQIKKGFKETSIDTYLFLIHKPRA
jgi:hypothetical protein